jgi:hypothetical protein
MVAAPEGERIGGTKGEKRQSMGKRTGPNNGGSILSTFSPHHREEDPAYRGSMPAKRSGIVAYVAESLLMT